MNSSLNAHASVRECPRPCPRPHNGLPLADPGCPPIFQLRKVYRDEHARVDWTKHAEAASFAKAAGVRARDDDGWHDVFFRIFLGLISSGRVDDSVLILVREGLIERARLR